MIARTPLRRVVAVALATALVIAPCNGAAADTTYDGPFVRGDAGVSIAAGIGSDVSGLGASWAGGAQVGQRFETWAFFGEVAGHFSRIPRVDVGEEVVMTTHVGVGAELLTGDGLLRTALSVGPTILTVPSSTDQGGEVGFYLDLRPVGLRWAVSERTFLGFDPLSWELVIPVLEGIPLVQMHFRTSLNLEHRF